ncbi:hypothetical protein LEP1GSC108_3787 [Leptospira weilii str. UI 13098]|uniref:Uncharacterized protein n=1 Tax=Leptospira weilii str. UI 13098 TaxID=1088542 RepID=M6Q8T5_9LEPT|nr:hypothetical protein LEP1GSC108_3787 [Leptospira weilii str. UI 13098]
MSVSILGCKSTTDVVGILDRKDIRASSSFSFETILEIVEACISLCLTQDRDLLTYCVSSLSERFNRAFSTDKLSAVSKSLRSSRCRFSINFISGIKSFLNCFTFLTIAGIVSSLFSLKARSLRSP